MHLRVPWAIAFHPFSFFGAPHVAQRAISERHPYSWKSRGISSASRFDGSSASFREVGAATGQSPSLVGIVGRTPCDGRHVAQRVCRQRCLARWHRRAARRVAGDQRTEQPHVLRLQWRAAAARQLSRCAALRCDCRRHHRARSTRSASSTRSTAIRRHPRSPRRSAPTRAVRTPTC